MSASKPIALTDQDHQPLQNNRQYRVKMVTFGTGTRTGAEYLVWKNDAAWSIRPVSLAGINSNHPLLMVENDTVKIKTNHASNYGVKVYTETLDLLNPTTSPSFFGASNHWQREIANLYYTDGDVGIGTTSPTEKLSVKGKIRAQEIKVEAAGINWPDYVFESSYNLMPLEKVEKYIAENGHLPEVPSAKEVGQDGLSVGSNQALLLKKIEELTLHLIAMEKKMNDQEIDLIEQNKKIDQQAKEIHQLKKSSKSLN